MSGLLSLTATELGPLLKNKELSPVEVTEEIIRMIERVDPVINSYITPLYEESLTQAHHAEREIMQGRYKGPLHGIPLGIKDNFYTKGIRTTAGSLLLADFIPEKNATVVDKLLDAGSIMLGKLNMHEFGGGLTNTNPFYGHARNPWNTEYMTGGSSGGSGAALAAGLAVLATGTDTFGSIRVPAAMCGIYGIKPTYGLISTHGVVPLAWSLDHPGPMARSISDLALMLNEMAGYDPEDPASLKVPLPDYRADLHKGIKGVKIGIPTYYMMDLDSDIEKLFHKAIDLLKEMGAEVREMSLPELKLSSFAGYMITPGEASSFHYEWLKESHESYAPDVRAFFQAGTAMSAPQYVRAQQSRREMIKAFDEAFETVDILLGPTVPITTPRFQESWVEQNLEIIRQCMPFTSPPNVTGTPSLALPMGVCSDGLPAGMQMIGKHLTEDLLLRAGKAWEDTGAWHP